MARETAAHARQVRESEGLVRRYPGRGYHVEEPTELTATIKKALNSGETSCVNVPIDPEFVLRIGASKLSV